MIEILIAKNGSRTLRKSGKLLASAVNPQEEARAWVQRRAGPFLQDVKSIFILGAGAGYHILELNKACSAQCIVIERSAEIVETLREIHELSENTSFVTIDKPAQLRSVQIVKNAVAQSFLVFTHAPSESLYPDFYNQCREFLLGRDWGSLNWQWQVKGFKPLDSETKIHKTEELLSIYDLDNSELVQNSEERERILIKALRELVK